jgi:hypothetical protein
MELMAVLFVFCMPNIVTLKWRDKMSQYVDIVKGYGATT